MAVGADESKTGRKVAGNAPPKSSAKRPFIIIGLLFALAIAAAGYLLFVRGGFSRVEVLPHTIESNGAKGANGDKEFSGAPVTLKFDPFIVNLTGSAGNRYLKVTINVELYPRAADEAGRKRARIRDSIINLLSSKSYADLVSVNGKYQLRDEIAARINLILSMGMVKSVYFTEFVIQ
jgi:flagellar FliL protein